MKGKAFDTAVCSDVVIDLLEAINTPIALSVALHIRYKTVYTSQPDPTSYLNASAYFADAQAVALVRKNPWIFPKSNDLSTEALRKFLEAESICKSTNDRFRRRAFSFRDRSVLETARQYCHSICNALRTDSLDFGPGATLHLRGQDANIVRKLCTLPECTPLAYELVVKNILDYMPHYAISSGMLVRERASLRLGTTKLNIVEGNRFTTVPKDCRSDRPICIEPMGNMLLQKAVGVHLRQALFNYGLDLNNAQALHKELVASGSRDDGLSTIDLSSASDTVSLEFVKFMLPEDWYDVLYRLRSRITMLPNGESILNEKFSSMGNGYTFELETLLFYSIALAIRNRYGKRDDRVSVFGDDIIISTDLFQPLTEILSVCGFSVNTEKSYSRCGFLESCGEDYFFGLPVRPVYFKELPSDETKRIFHMANRVREIARRYHFSDGCDSLFRRVWLRIISWLPAHKRYYGPVYYGDDVIIAHDDEITFRKSDGYLQVRILVSTPLRRIKPSRRNWHDLTCALYGIPSSGVAPRGTRTSLRVRWAPYFQGEASGYKWV